MSTGRKRWSSSLCPHLVHVSIELAATPMARVVIPPLATTIGPCVVFLHFICGTRGLRSRRHFVRWRSTALALIACPVLPLTPNVMKISQSFGRKKFLVPVHT